MNSVEKVKAICKERKIPISRLEKDLGFGNGYIRSLKEGKFPSDRLKAIANYLEVTIDFLLETEETETKPETNIVLDSEARELLEELKTRPEMRTLFSVSRKATKEDILKAVKIIEALKGDD